MVGKTVAHYRIVEKLGEGGMGEVYLAQDTELDRQVALKFLPEEFASDPEFLARFKREAQSAAGLNHPNIITIYEIGQHEGRPFIAMAYVEGSVLSDIIAGGDTTTDRAIDIALQILSGLDRAHDAGIVHRDIKPDNIFIDRDGRVKILDFGLAKRGGASRHTGVTSTFGTVHYMSPEQARGEVVDHRSDLFSLGALFYEMLTGQRPFRGEHSAAILYSIINEEPQPMSRYNSTVSPGLERIVAKMLAKKKEDRYASAADIAEDLNRVRAGSAPVTARRLSPRLMKLLLPTSAVFLAVILLVIFKPFKFEISPDQKALAAENSLAIMYFENLVNREDPKRLGEIVTNLLITDLSESEYMEVVSGQRLYDILKLEGLEDTKTIDRTTATQVATRAGAKWMLLGSILQEQPHYIMTSQLVDVKNGKIIASQRITGESGEKIFSLVDRLTNEIKGDLALPAAAKGEADTPVADVTTHSTEAYRHYLEGMDYVNKYYAKEAKASFEKALAYDSTLAMAHWALALNSVPTSKSEKRKAIVRAVRHSDKVSKRGQEYIRYTQARLEGDYDGAVKILNQLIAENPKDKEAYKELGNIYMNVRHDSERAIASYRKAIEIDPLDKASYNVLAYEYQNQGDIDNYIWAIYQYMTLAPDEANPFDSRADLYAFSGNIDKAIESYTEALKRKPDYYPSLRKIGFMQLFKMDYEGAKAHFQKFLASSDPDARSEGRLYLAFIPMFQGRLEAALDILDQGILGDQAEGYRGFAHVRKFFHKSIIFSEKNEFDQAIAEAKKMVELQQKLESEDPPDRSLLIYLLARKNDFSKAERQLAELKTRLEGTSKTGMADYWGVKGWVEMLKGNPDSACTAFEKAAENVNYFFRRYPLALAYLKAGRLVESIHEFEKLLRRYSEDRANGPIWAVELCYHLGVAYEESGRYDRAIEKYEEFLSIWKDASPALEEVGDARERLARLKAAG